MNTNVASLWNESAYIRTHSGLKFHPRFIKSLVVNVRDVAWQLSRVNRYNGCLDVDLYSVAQHSVLVHDLVLLRYDKVTPKWQRTGKDRTNIRLQALFHDIDEAYLPDIPSPYKSLLPDLSELSSDIRKEAFKQLGVPLPFHPFVKQTDVDIRLTEIRSMSTWEEPGPVAGSDTDFYILPLTAKEAERRFMQTYEDIINERG